MESKEQMKDTTSDRIGDENSLVFTGEYTFSIRCGKCADIHNAQLEGKTTEACNCDCHGEVTPNYTPCVPYYPPCPCPHWPQPYYYTTTGDTTCDNPHSPTSGGCTCQ
jgi:hypothetical protein